MKGLQATLAEVIAPELTSMFAQSVAQVSQMLIESIAAELDAAVEDLCSDNRELADVLAACRDGIAAALTRNEPLASLVPEIETLLAEPGDASLAVSRLASRNGRLQEMLERTLMAIEDVAGTPELEALTSPRAAAYRHLRRVAARGWSFWDLGSFRERIAEFRAGQ